MTNLIDVYFKILKNKSKKSDILFNKRFSNISLNDLIKYSDDDYFDPKYKGNKNNIMCFKNYGIHNSRRGKINNILKKIKN